VGAALAAERPVVESLPASGGGRRRALGLVAVVGLAWSLLSLALWRAGHAPAVDIGPLPHADWYLWQGLMLPLLLPLLFAIHAGITVRIAGPARGGWGGLARAYSASVLLMLVLPEAVALVVGGPAALSAVARFSGAGMPMAALAATTWVLHRERGIGMVEGAGRALPGLLAQAVLGAVFLR